jgi:hypothetical protein
LALFAALPLTATPDPAPAPDAVDAAWDAVAVLDFRSARLAFGEAVAHAEGPGAARRATLGLAATLLSDAPITEERVNEAERLLAGLFAGGEGDDVAVLARYLHARIPQVHRGMMALRAGSSTWRLDKPGRATCAIRPLP